MKINPEKTHQRGRGFALPCSRWFFCRRGFLSPGARRDAEGRTGSLGHLVAWEDEEPGRWVSDNDSSSIAANQHPPDGQHQATCAYLGCFGLADSQGFPEVGVDSVIGFPLSLGRLDPVGNDLDYWRKRERRRQSKVYSHTNFGRNQSKKPRLLPSSSLCNPPLRTCKHCCSPYPW